MLPTPDRSFVRSAPIPDAITHVSTIHAQFRFRRHSGPRRPRIPAAPGVDIDRFAPDPDARWRIRQQLGLGDRPTVLCLSRVVPRKGQTCSSGAARDAREVPDVALVIAGGGTRAEKLHELADANGTGKHVVFAARSTVTSPFHA